MSRIEVFEQYRIVFVSSLSAFLGYLTPTKGFVYALVVMFAFNIWAGMGRTAWRLRDAKTFRSGSLKTHCLVFTTITLVALFRK